MGLELGICKKKAWAAMVLAHAATSRKIDAALRQEGLPSLEIYDVLLALEAAEAHRMRMVDLAQTVIYSPSGLTRLIDRIEASGLVERQACPTDRRAIWVCLTPKGLELRQASWGRYAQLIQEHFGKWLSDEEAESIAAGLEKVHEGEGMRKRC